MTFLGLLIPGLAAALIIWMNMRTEKLDLANPERKPSLLFEELLVPITYTVTIALFIGFVIMYGKTPPMK